MSKEFSDFSEDVLERCRLDHEAAEKSDGEIREGTKNKKLSFLTDVFVKKIVMENEHLRNPWMRLEETSAGPLKTNIKTYIFEDSKKQPRLDMVFLPLATIYPDTRGSTNDIFVARQAFLRLGEGKYWDFVVHEECYTHRGSVSKFRLIVKILPAYRIIEDEEGYNYYHKGVTGRVYDRIMDDAEHALETARKLARARGH